MSSVTRTYLAGIIFGSALMTPVFGQDTSGSSAPAAPAPLPSPAITGPLQAAPPNEIDAGPLGKLSVNGVLSGMGLLQSNRFAGDATAQGTLSNGQIFIQKTTGWWQFFVEAGVYDLPTVGVPYLPADKTLSDLYGPVPVAFLKLVPGKNTSILVGALPTLMGSEYMFTFENMNVERGLLWYQENTITRGIQVNQTFGKFTAAVSWNDGYYSNRYTSMSGSLTYTNGAHSVAFAGMGNLGQTVFQNLATPVQNNGSMYAVMYTYSHGAWIVQPYFQMGNVPANSRVGVVKGASTPSFALLVNRSFKKGISLAGRTEYLKSTGTAGGQAVNLLYGSGSAAFSMTVAPTYQRGRFFVRGDISYVHATDYTPGWAFGAAGTLQNQTRAVIETGFLL